MFSFNNDFREKGFISGVFSLYNFKEDSVARNIMHNLKYNSKFKIGFFLGNEFASHYRNILSQINIDLIIPVPLNKIKKYERGYNQSYYIALGIKEMTALPVNPSVLKRSRFTPSQTKLNREERLKNIAGAFRVVKPAAVKNKNVLLIDDVITTGATINECAGCLKSAGAKSIYAGAISLA